MKTAVDLFAGAGGASQGLKDAGYSILAAVENDADACKTYRLNHPEARLEERDIREVDADALRDALDLRRGDLTLLKSCPPCQGYSTLGRVSHDDPRNDLVDDTWRFVRAFQPSLFIIENVPGLHRDQRLERLIRRTRAVGYSVRKYIVNAIEFGVPQHRRRLIVIGSRTGSSPRLVEDIPSSLPKDFDASPQTVADAFSRCGPVDSETDVMHRSVGVSARVQERIKAIPKEGGSRHDLPADLQLACHKRLLTRQAGASYGRMRSDDAAPTMTTRCTTPACGRFLHPQEDRPVTLREAAVLQTFPVEYSFIGSRQSIERQIGNAVPVKMAEGLGHFAATLLDQARK